jgi:T5orf172 domain
MNIRGWVYIISNPAMPGLLKVGFSRKDPQLRALEHDTTGCPQPYSVKYDD